MFLRFINYYIRFVSNLSRIEAPIRKLLTASHFTWPKEADDAVRVIKELVCQNTVLVYPARHDKLVINSDLSDDGVVAVILQIDSKWIKQPIAFASWTVGMQNKVDSPKTKTQLNRLGHYWQILLLRQWFNIYDSYWQYDF